MLNSTLTCFNGLDLVKYEKIMIYQERYDADTNNFYYWDEFLEYFNYDFYKAYDCWNLSLINSDFYDLFPKYKKSSNDKKEITFCGQNYDDLSNIDKKDWYKLSMPNIIDFSIKSSLPEDLIIHIGHFTDLINFRLINKNIFRRILDIFVYKYIKNLCNLHNKLIYLKYININPTYQASYIYYSKKINCIKSPCNAITKKGTFCKNLTHGNQKCHCHKSKKEIYPWYEFRPRSLIPSPQQTNPPF